SPWGGGASANGNLSLFNHNYVLDAKELPAAKMAYLGIETSSGQDEAREYEDFAELHFSGGGGTSATGIRDKAGFTIVPMDAPRGHTKLCLSLALKEERGKRPPEFQVIAVDAASKRYESQDKGGMSAGGNGATVITMLLDYSLSSDRI